MYSNGFFNMMIYTHTINTSLESNNVNDDDAIDLITYTIKFNNLLDSIANILFILNTKQFLFQF